MKARDTGQQQVWTHKEDEQWAARFELALACRHDAPSGLAEEVLAEVRELAAEAGRPVQDVAGDPDAYADTVAAERISEVRRSSADMDGVPPGGRFTAALVLAGVQVVLFGIMLWVSEGFWLSAGWPQLSGATLLTTVFVAAVGVLPELRAAARLLAWRITLVAVCVLVVATATLFTSVRADPFVHVPAPALFGVGGLLAFAGFRLSYERAGRWFAGAPAAARHVDDEAWLARLEALLKGRHGYRSGAAARSREEARDHLEASGGSAVEEFGPVEIYAMRLAEGPARPGRSARAQLFPAAAMCALCAWWGCDLLTHPEAGSAWFWIKAGVLLLGMWTCGSTLRGLRTALRRDTGKNTGQRRLRG
ncbi:hypothetical protein ACFYM2_12045 [Streptomyces sp. NPDC006711]|uniref:hypothetical protein n=1 Tax=Streptomyces sp. NPDC006711 TaxID=3364762 RepID=UPI0036B932A2